MPRVPTAEGLGVLPTIRSGGARPVLSVEQAAMPGRQMQERGAQMMQIGAQIGDYAQQQQERINRARVQDATMQAERLALEYRQQMEQLQGAQAAEGIDGMPIGAYFSRELERGTAEIERSLGSPAAREAFRAQALALQSRFGERAMLYEAQQAEAFIGQTQDTLITHNNNFLAANAGGPDEGLYRDRLKEAYAEKFRREGFAGEGLAQEVRKEMAKSHAIIIEQFLNVDQYSAAKAYFERYRDDFLEIDAKKIEAAMAEQGRELEAFGKADQIWQASGGAYNEALLAVRQIADPQERQAVEARLATLKSQDDAAKKAKDDADEEELLSYVVSGRSIPATMLADVSPRVIDRIQAEQNERNDRARAMAAMSAEEKAAIRQASAFNYNILKLQVSDPEFAQMGLEGLLADPELQVLYNNMTDEDRNKLYLDLAQGKQGVPPDKVTQATKDILALSGTMLPENLKPSSIAGLGRAELGERFISANQVKSDLALRTEGELVRLVEAELTRTGGAPIDSDRARQLFGLALAEAGGLTRKGVPRYAPPEEVVMNDAALVRQRAILDLRAQQPDIWRAATIIAREQNPGATDADVYLEAERMQALIAQRRVATTVRGIGTQISRAFNAPTATEEPE